MSDSVEYWKNRAKLAEEELDRLQSMGADDLGNDASAFDKFEQERLQSSGPEPAAKTGGWTQEERDGYYDSTGLRLEALDALRLLMSRRLIAGENAMDVATRLVGYEQDRTIALEAAKRAGHSPEEDPRVVFVVSEVVKKLLADLSSGRQMVEFLSRPPMMEIAKLPIGAVVVHGGRMLEVKRAPETLESTVVCYEWNRDDRPAAVDKKQLVSPLGRVKYDDRKKTIRLGLLEIVGGPPENADPRLVSDPAISAQPNDIKRLGE